MITAGIDIGAETVKAAIISDGTLAGWSVIKAELDWKASADGALEMALNRAGITRAGLDRIFATGVGRNEVAAADKKVTDIISDARGASFLFPAARTVIDIGAEEARGIRLNPSGRVLDFAKNDKCAAGVGVFIESMARALDTTVEEMGPLSLKSQKAIPMNVTCVVFAESEVVSLIHSQTPKEDIARAIHEAIANRTVSMVKQVGIEKEVVFIGGVANNAGVADRLRNLMGMEILIPEQPQIAGAIGAALIAAEQIEK